jgi:hypothetical protein
LFQDLKDFPGIPHFWVADEHVEVFRHEHISVHTEAVPPASLFEDGEKCILDAIVGEQRPAPIATAGDEVRA